MQIVHFHETNPGRVVYTAHNRRVVARWQVRNDGRFGWIGWSVAAVLNISYLVPRDNTADYRMLPISTLSPVWTNAGVLMLPSCAGGPGAKSLLPAGKLALTERSS